MRKNKVSPRILAEIEGFEFKYLNPATQVAYEKQSEEMFWLDAKHYIKRRKDEK
jgi:hypothetical protein